MLGLTLRKEFRGQRTRGTVIEFTDSGGTGATQVEAAQFLEITYPTHDLLKALEAVSPGSNRPIAVIGERGLGKSHLMAALYHAMNNVTATSEWLRSWSVTLGRPALEQLVLRGDMLVIGESLHQNRFKHLWDVLFEKHPHGSYIRGKWEMKGTAVPSDELITELLNNRPTALLLDEFQTWYDSQSDTEQSPDKRRAFNFIQVLSEIARNRPELLVLVVSVRNGESDAYQQIHRVSPVTIDFKAGGNAERMQQDRRRMLLHRLFENRQQIPSAQIDSAVRVHAGEYFRLLNVPPAEHERRYAVFLESWPFAPHLLRLLEEQVLVATDAQETRDMIRILVNLYKGRGEASPVLTAADFRLDDDTTGIGALLDSVANEHHRTLREKAQANILSVIDAMGSESSEVPHLQELMGALWLRSIAVGNNAGAEPSVLQADLTRTQPLDDNAFHVELNSTVENSFNIHIEGPRLVFREQENPLAKLMVFARNDKLFIDGLDRGYLARELRYVIGGSAEVATTTRVIVLPQNWDTDPWSTVEESERPERWDGRLPLLILPENSEQAMLRLGPWLKTNLQQRRNTVRFLLPVTGTTNLYQEKELLLLARAAMKAQEWSSQNPEYRKLHTRFQNELRDKLKARFDRFMLLDRFDYANPNLTRFHVERLTVQGSQVPKAIEIAIAEDLFVPEDFEDLVTQAARDGSTVGKLLRDLQEPRPNVEASIPWLGETPMKERLLRLCAQGKVALNVRGMEYLQAYPGEEKDEAWTRLKSKLPLTGRQLDEVYLVEPSAVPVTGGSVISGGPSHNPVSTQYGQVGMRQTGSNIPTGIDAGMGAPNTMSGTPISIFGSGQATSGLSDVAEVIGTTSGGGTDASITGSSSFRPPLIPQRVAQRNPVHVPATSSLNLLHRMEQVGVQPATRIGDISIRVSAATGAQLMELLKKLPDGLTYELELQKEES
ncbi:DUF499 domain-containing protein [Deinococcus aquatilis]|uniref:DUF499 domain-containing protein n=1 Tax=Deinococcus aquatilis TaxID=519440 RepID=UPI00035FD510|nr:DUF499 domain-containing protein [Deinococcus aquatilis]